jgi:hypothetical protein
MPTQAEIDAAKAAKEKKNSNNIVVASGGEAHFSDGKVHGDAKVVGTTPGGFDHGIKKRPKTFTQPGQEGEVHDSWDEIKKNQNAYQLSLVDRDEAAASSGSGGSGGSGSSNKPYVKAGGKSTGNMKDYAIGSQERRDEYTARGWKQDSTTKVKDTKPKQPQFTESLKVNGKITPVADLDEKYTKELPQQVPGGTTSALTNPSGFTSVNKPHRASTNTSNNKSIGKTTAAANAPESLMAGTKTRREQRQQLRQQNKMAFQAGLQADKQDRQDNRSRRQGNRQEKRNQRQTGNKFVSGADAQAASDRTKALMTPQVTEKKKKSDDGEFWGKRGPIVGQ